MEAKRCDCCGTYYQIAELRKIAEQTAAQMNKYRGYERTKPLVGIALQYENNTQLVIDLCPSCMQKIIDVVGGKHGCSKRRCGTSCSERTGIRKQKVPNVSFRS